MGNVQAVKIEYPVSQKLSHGVSSINQAVLLFPTMSCSFPVFITVAWRALCKEHLLRRHGIKVYRCLPLSNISNWLLNIYPLCRHQHSDQLYGCIKRQITWYRLSFFTKAVTEMQASQITPATSQVFEFLVSGIMLNP